MSEADEKYMDEYDKYNIEQDKYENHAHSGKGRTKKEAAQHHYEDPSGHTRKAMQKLMNNAHKHTEKHSSRDNK
uniref:Nuclear protein 1 n=1 Tax=Arion vulgaris TaxID=1028688 RepID=A0A0B7ATZ7_9EUPU